ncbi:hypothetical protein KSP39_PZI012410 [Platanthera zijinensis]|uniref:Uncharacterized protein n=1 Tax=Platanthera zijinensis TaxID=2320716 RepID=A0AAP0BF36_9ASPA
MEISAADSPTRRSSASSSPEFEFWRLRNPPPFDQQLPLLSADELFAGGILLPLHILSLNPSPNSSLPPPLPQPPVPADTCPPPPSKKWKDIFKPGEKKPAAEKKDKKTFAAAAASTIAATEINIHIWPFSRSRSAGNNRPRFISSTSSRKTSSAPCSRCNSHGESSKNAADGTAANAAPAAAAAARKWAPNPSRAGGRIYLGRSNPVWQLRRRNTASEKQGIVPSAGKGRTIKLNVNTCIAHKMPASCRDCEKDGKPVLHDCSGGGVDSGGAAEGGAGGELNGSLFNLRAMFTRKVS